MIDYDRDEQDRNVYTTHSHLAATPALKENPSYRDNISTKMVSKEHESNRKQGTKFDLIKTITDLE